MRSARKTVQALWDPSLALKHLGAYCPKSRPMWLQLPCKRLKDLFHMLMMGISIGPIARPGRWPDYVKPQKAVPVEDALARAWAIRRKIIQGVGRSYKGLQVSR